jgi:hypothetical protein
MANDSDQGGAYTPGQGEGAIDWGAALPDTEWLKIRPGDPEVVMTVLATESRTSNFKDERGNPKQEIVVTCAIDGIERKWSPNVGALRELGANGVRVGDTIKVKRAEDTVRNGRTLSTWFVEKVMPRSQVDREMDARVERAADGSDHPFDDEAPAS